MSDKGGRHAVGNAKGSSNQQDKGTHTDKPGNRYAKEQGHQPKHGKG